MQDLFGSMPVRVKQRREDGKEWELLKRCLVGLLLAWDSVTAVSMRDVAVTKKLHVRGIVAVQDSQDNGSGKPHKTNSFDLRKIVSILSQAAYVEPSNQDTWVKTSARTLLMTIRGAFSLVPAPTKHVQFISLGIRPLDPEVGGSILYDEINRIFSASSFGSLEDCSDADERVKDRRSKDKRYKQDGFTNKQLKGGGKGIDKWPMFYIRIELQDASRFQYRSERAFLEGGSTLSSILEVLGAMITGFLKEYHFRPRARPLRRLPPEVGDLPSSSSRPGSRSAFKRLSSRANTQSGDIDEGPESISRSTSHPSIHFVESKGGSTIGRPKSSVTKDLLSSIDTFGGSVKIPSFSQRKSYHSGEGLTSWSRIKSGKRYTSDGTSLKLDSAKSTTRSETAILKPSTEGEGVVPLMNDGPGTMDAAHSLVPSCDDQPMTTGNESDPFVEECSITARGDQTIGDSTQHATAANGLNSLDDDCGPATATDETTIWTNPISKEQFLISTRTGLVVPKSSTRSSSASTNPECPSLRGTRRDRWSRKRVKLSRNISDPFVTPKEGSWVGDFLRSWENPTFRPAEESISQVSYEGPTLEASHILHGRHHRCSHVDIENAFRESSTSFSAKLSKDGLKNAEVIAQVDKKFILVKMCMECDTVALNENKPSVLVLIDQHAADERVRVEALLHDLCQPPSASSNIPRSSLDYTSAIATTLLAKPFIIQIPAREHKLFKIHAAHFADWGILYDLIAPRTGPSLVESSDMGRMTFRALPPAIAERCRLDVKQLVELMRGEMWKREEAGGGGKREMRLPRPASQPEALKTSPSASIDDGHNWLHRTSTCPQGIIDMLNSRSCRSAIMFNDELNIDECKTLVQKLSRCAFPFQCAHGRPSMVPLVDLSTVRDCFSGDEDLGFGAGRVSAVGPAAAEGQGQGRRGFAEAWGRWMEQEKGKEGVVVENDDDDNGSEEAG